MRSWRVGLFVGCLMVIVLALGAALTAGGLSYFRSGQTVEPTPEAVLSESSDSKLEKAGPSAVNGAVNRIAVVGTDGNLFTIGPDGDNLLKLTEDASQRQMYRYPTWSPDGSELAFVEVSENEEQSFDSALHIVSLDGATTKRVPTEFPPFYLFWNPTGEALAFLSNWTDGMALRMVSKGVTEAKTISQGMPFFFSWEPTGERMVAHIGEDVLTFLDGSDDGKLDDEAWERQPLDISPGFFQAPHWSADGNRLAFVTKADSLPNESVLNVSNAKADKIIELARRPGILTFNWAPDSQRIAYSYTERSLGMAAFGPLWVHDTFNGEAWELSKKPVVAFFWSPDGQYLAFLRPEEHEPVEPAPQAAPLRQGRQLWLRWHIWDGEQTYPLTVFSPSEPFIFDYLRYFDQYAQSISFWSPDSQMLLYTGLSERGYSGVWVLPVGKGSQERQIANGTVAAWSPR